MRRRILFCAALVALGAAGCKVGPDYERPAIAVPAAFSEAAPGAAAAAEPAGLGEWWRTLRDPVLISLVERAEASSLRLQEARVRIHEARAQRAVVAAGLFPAASPNASYSNNRLSEHGFIQDLRGVFSGPGPGAVLPGTEIGLYQAGFDASWEADIFGGVRRAVEAAEAEVSASVEDARGLQVSLLAELGRDYVQLRELQERVGLARETLRAEEETLGVVRQRSEAGIASDLDLARAEAEVEVVRARLPALEGALRRTQHAIEILLGEPPGALERELTAPAPIPAAPDAVSAGLPSDLLLRRPDLRHRERELAAATARIGAARADLFPRFSLTGAFGFQSQDIGTLAQAASRYWAVSPAVRWPIFEGGRIRANVEVERARTEEALLRYKASVLDALGDVENALLAYAREKERAQALERTVAADERALRAAQDLYQNGLADFLSVLDAERSLYGARDQLAQSRAAITTHTIALYKALGGGWEGEGRAGRPGPPGGR